jgi:hypothetical protein
MKKIIKNKWHLHSLTFVLCIVALYLTDEFPNFMTIGESGNFLQGFLCVFCSASLAFIIEWIQGKFFGANKSWSEVIESRKDILVSIIAGTIGMITYFLFN